MAGPRGKAAIEGTPSSENPEGVVLKSDQVKIGKKQRGRDAYYKNKANVKDVSWELITRVSLGHHVEKWRRIVSYTNGAVKSSSYAIYKNRKLISGKDVPEDVRKSKKGR